jgi:putative transposase
MPRRARLRIPGLPLHVVQRGHNKAPCFLGERDFRLYLALLEELGDRHGCEIHAYVLMTNHVHLLATPREADSISFFMRHLGQRFAQYFNRKYSRTGSLWEARFRSCIVDSEAYLLRCYRYIELNPVRANMVQRPGEYAWSSYGTNAAGKPSDFLIPHYQYLALGREDNERLRNYEALFQGEMTAVELKQIRDTLNGGTALGCEQFIAKVEQRLGVTTVHRRPGRPRKPLADTRSA